MVSAGEEASSWVDMKESNELGKSECFFGRVFGANGSNTDAESEMQTHRVEKPPGTQPAWKNCGR